ncbi:tir motif-containing protein [Plakobranchus ocellatus]|uniref:Tir motif-containing protein n=1 Tax=Plakobranchus ocellatus TaxID=259542 RepID=A0AAV4B422_9GAST|nr:tir motif-containing protein [Plakobranchus ocellatus]
MSEQEGVRLVNISLTHSGTSKESDTSLGAIAIAKNVWRNLYLPNLRQLMKQQLPQVLPDRFVFLTSERFKIPLAQEYSIHSLQVCEPVTRIIYIQHSYDLPRVAIKTVDESKDFGHIYTTYNSSLRDIREDVQSKCLDSAERPRSFNFVLPDGPLVFLREESSIPVHEALRREEIYIQLSNEPYTEDAFDTMALIKRKSPEPFQNGRRKSIRLSFASNKDMEHNSAQPLMRALPVSKQLLISYVRAEAAEHAHMLKRSLNQIGFSVYLDVDEIKSGLDWQDALNYAVSNCEVFIPLVTPRYGETQWTNREVKLADVLGKSILPISFLDEWPPRCLAIQFATTQYIGWKTQEQIHEELEAGKEDAKDIRIWSEGCIDHVANEIKLRVKNLRSGQSLSKPALRRIKTLLKTFAGRLPASAAPEITSQDNEETAGPTIVVSAHFEDASLGFQVKGWLEAAGHSVWISCVKAVCSEDIADNAKKCDNENCPCKKASKMKQLQEEFQETVDKASLVIFILSQSSAFSKICSQQVFYCEHRKQILPILFGDFDLPGWMKMLIRSQRCLNANGEKFQATLLNQVKRALDPTAKNCLDSDNREANIALAVQCVKKNLNIERCVYVSGSTLANDERAEAICRSIGKELAKRGDIHIVSSGSYGTSDLLSEVFYKESQKLSNQTKAWHVLPERDLKDKSRHYNQCADGTFALKDFGHTLFCGNSVWERETIVGRCFRVCLLVVGGSYSSHEIQEFVWSDRIVVPVNCPDVAVEGNLKATAKLYQLPTGVDEADWKCLNNPSCPPEEIGPAVARVLSGLLQHFQNQNRNSTHPSEIATPLLSEPPSTPVFSQFPKVAPPKEANHELLSTATSTTDLVFTNSSEVLAAAPSLQKAVTQLLNQA